jgi:ABC-type Mn2+/Zn2+ transport system ATPase subunit
MRKAAWFECDVDALGSYLSRLDVEVPERSPVSKWSLGNRQRVRIASALASQRKVVLMDEPFRSIDEAHLHSLVSLLAEEAKTRLIIVSTHRPELLAGLAKAAVVLSDNSSFQPPHMARPSGQIRVQLAKRAEASTVEIQTRTVSRSDLPEVLQTLALPESEVLSLLVQPDYSVGRDE